MEIRTRHRLRSASVQLGALTALALTLSGCNLGDDDDDDCAMGPAGGGGSVVTAAFRAPAATTLADATTGSTGTAAVPDRGGFGTHLASCGG